MPSSRYNNSRHRIAKTNTNVSVSLNRIISRRVRQIQECVNHINIAAYTEINNELLNSHDSTMLDDIVESADPVITTESEPMLNFIQSSELLNGNFCELFLSFHAKISCQDSVQPKSVRAYLRELPLACQPLIPSWDAVISQRHSLGAFDVQCPSCHALHWADERLARSSLTSPKFGTCCNSGKISWPVISNPLEPLRSLLDSNNQSDGMFFLV